GSAEIVDVSSGARVLRRSPDRDHVRAVLLRDDRGPLFVHADGSIRPEFGTAAFAGRLGESLLAQIPGHGVVIVRADHSLVVWDPESGTESVLVANLPEPLIALRASRDGSTVLYVAGQKAQQLGTVLVGETDSAWMLPWTGPRILDADIDP